MSPHVGLAVPANKQTNQCMVGPCSNLFYSEVTFVMYLINSWFHHKNPSEQPYRMVFKNQEEKERKRIVLSTKLLCCTELALNESQQTTVSAFDTVERR